MRKLNDWTILDEFSEDGRRWYHVQCKCGWDGQRRKDHVESGRTKSCKVCSTKKTLADFPNPRFGGRHHEGVGDLGRTFWCAIQHGAERREIPFNISIEYAWGLFTGKCALSGVPITISSNIKEGNPDYSKFTASLDRIDSSKGYIEGNVQWVHKIVNIMKGSLSEREFKKWCSLIEKPS